MPDYLLVSTTAGSRESAADLLRLAVRERLAASGQVFGPALSAFWHLGEFGEGEEWQVLLKTEADRARFVFANISTVLILVGIFSFGFSVLTGVVEEKQSRVVAARQPDQCGQAYRGGKRTQAERPRRTFSQPSGNSKARSALGDQRHAIPGDDGQRQPAQPRAFAARKRESRRRLNWRSSSNNYGHVALSAAP